jgi:iron complex outermembrane recepter protein
MPCASGAFYLRGKTIGRSWRVPRFRLFFAWKTDALKTKHLSLRSVVAAAVFAAPVAALAQTPADVGATVPVVLPSVDVVGSTPLLGSGLDRNKVPAATTVVNSRDIARDGIPSPLRALHEGVPGVTLDDAAGNPYQPTLFYHGFQASPLQGNGQGLAVYLDGVRFNQAFGETVNWDLLPDMAIDRMELSGSNPVFGLNALGGALSVKLKNGFTYQGAEIDVFGGSFGRKQGAFQHGRQSGDTSTYIAATAAHQDGWRDRQSSDLYNVFGDLGWRSDRAEVHFNIVAADTVLNGPGTSPVQLLATDRRAQFTAPNLIANKFTMVSLNGSLDVSDATSVQGAVYYDYFLQRVINGNVTGFLPCDDGSGFLCQDSGAFATDRAGNPIRDFLSGGPYSVLDRHTTNTNGYGGSVQVTNSQTIFGHNNKFVAGVSFDGARTMFGASSAIGGLTLLDRNFIGPGIVIDQPDGSIAPVRVGIGNAYYGVFFTDTFDVTPHLSLTVAGRFNTATIDLKDQNGTALTGNHVYTRFNPSAGLTYRVFPTVSVYASYAEANRAPTPAELSCASPETPCSLANFFVGDPDLKQVVAHTVEAGVRGQFRPWEGATLRWDVGAFHTDLDDDILFVNSPVQGRAFFRNVGTTRRQGVDLGGRLTTGKWSGFIGYSFIDATFQSGFTASSENNPGADADGNVQVRPGNRLPGIPSHILKIGGSYQVTDHWTVGATGIAASGQYLAGDEANLQAKTPGYFVLNLNTSYQITSSIQLFGLVENVFDTKYYTFGTFSPTSSVFLAQAPGATNTRSYSPAAPLAGYGGVRMTF